MMQIAELIARKYGLSKIILTVIKGTFAIISVKIYPPLFCLTHFHCWRRDNMCVALAVCGAAENKGALDFYKSKLKYVLDESDPSEEGRAEPFEILSKTLVRAWLARLVAVAFLCWHASFTFLVRMFFVSNIVSILFHLQPKPKPVVAEASLDE